MKKFFKKHKKFKKEHESVWLNMDFYWQLAVGFMFLAGIFSLFFGYYLFMKVNKESVVEPAVNDGKTETVQKERIDKALEYFNLKKQKSDQILSLPAPIVDPSL